ncbi:hypothetical protein CEUSTIGMA_g12492.t1 [Chlamydomonas eustigma]|uniref:Uncharacterized protein n=1 Tax=Chlamydomonas eustigma TaxID=1157962 RepID=A0A250XQ67_9CHLO|nr:hypothetical protein CEUSTIGMA_g12492.t1 [Chlamydomonas eustigma]|eukprot:GAX85072.1 hypothetical protein CEUSTIGMA_g12492.t1 [Chlamydomonas eustigma]
MESRDAATMEGTPFLLGGEVETMRKGGLKDGHDELPVSSVSGIMDTISSTTTRLIPPQVHCNLSTTTRFRMELRAPSKSGYARSLYLANILSSPVEQAAVARRMKKECASLWPAAQVLQVNNKAHVSDYDKAADATNNDHLHRLAMLKSAGSYVRKAQGILKSRPLTQGLDSRYLKYCVVPSKPLLSSQRSNIMATDPHHAIISKVISAGPTYIESGAVVKNMTTPLCSLSPAAEFLCCSAGASSSGGLLSLLTLSSKSDKSDTQLMARDSAPSQMDLPCVQHNEGHHIVDHGLPSSSNSSTERRRALVKYEPQTSISNEKSNSGVTGSRSAGLPHDEGSVKVNAAAVAEGKTKTAAVIVNGSNKAVQFSAPMSSDDVSCEIKQDRFLLLHSSTNALTSLGSSSSSNSHGSRSRSRHWSNPGHSGMIVPGGGRPKSWHDDDSNRAILNDDVQIRIMVADEGNIEGMRRAASPLSPAAGQQQQASSLLSFKAAMTGRVYTKEGIVRTKAGSTNDVTLNSDVRMEPPVDMVCKGGLESNNPAGLSGRACTDVQHHLKNRNDMMSASVKITADRYPGSGPQSESQPQSPRGRPQALLIPPSLSGQALSVMSVRRRVSERLVCLYKSLQASIGRKQQQQLESDTQQQ